jgi:hypothetical protein
MWDDRPARTRAELVALFLVFAILFGLAVFS